MEQMQTNRRQSKIWSDSPYLHENLGRASFYYPGRDILELWNVLLQVWFTTSKTVLDIFRHKEVSLKFKN